MITTVMPPAAPAIMSSMAACTRCSLSASRAEVASSSSSTRGRRTSARAMAIRCFWPPLSCTPFSPTSVSYPSGSAAMKSCAFASRAASRMRSSEGSSGVPSSPKMMFLRIERANSVGSWPTSATCRWNHLWL
mmetsp:Transcript_15374/g.24259  ORF Transcript_15374/g.24259 Transcript_15374/m.24259 type:complete len:133 (-) Transcript_15374:322-720(-)